MSTKMKAFIGITATLVFLIVLFTSKGGYRANRENEDTACSVVEKVSENETIAQAE